MKIQIIVAAIAAWAVQNRGITEAAKYRHAAPCLAADAFTADFIADLKTILAPASTDSFDLAFRAASHLVATPDSAIAVVTDSSSCAQELTTYNTKVTGPTPAPTQVYVIRAGVLYVVTTPLPAGTARTSNVVVDSTFAAVGVFLR